MKLKVLCALAVLGSAISVTGQETTQPNPQEVKEAVQNQEAVLPQVVSETREPEGSAPIAQEGVLQEEVKPVEQPTAQEQAQQPEPEVKAAEEQVPVVQEQKEPEMPEPAPVQEVPSEMIPSEDEVEPQFIDTVDQSKGNWLLKRIWWEKAERLYEKIKELADKIIDLRIVFFNKRHEIDHTILDPFYLSLGLEQGEIGEIISYFTKQLEQEQPESLTEKEKQLLETITQEKKTLEQLQNDTQVITKINYAIDDALMKLVEQLNQVRYYENQAWQNFKAINRELNDKKARELYYGMDTNWKNLNNINTYLSDAYPKYFEQLVNKIQQETDKIKTMIQGLKEKGIDIQEQAQKIKLGTGKTQREETPEESEQAEGFASSIWNILKSPFVLLGNAVSGIFGWVGNLFGSSPEEEVTLAKPARTTQEAAAMSAEMTEE